MTRIPRLMVMTATIGCVLAAAAAASAAVRERLATEPRHYAAETGCCQLLQGRMLDLARTWPLYAAVYRVRFRVLVNLRDQAKVGCTAGDIVASAAAVAGRATVSGAGWQVVGADGESVSVRCHVLRPSVRAEVVDALVEATPVGPLRTPHLAAGGWVVSRAG